MVEYDLNKVDKAEVKFDKFVTMLQVKYGYTRQEARDKIGTLWTEYEANHKISVWQHKEQDNWIQHQQKQKPSAHPKGWQNIIAW